MLAAAKLEEENTAAEVQKQEALARQHAQLDAWLSHSAN